MFIVRDPLYNETLTNLLGSLKSVTISLDRVGVNYARTVYSTKNRSAPSLRSIESGNHSGKYNMNG
jgi:hypothetical protein